MLEIIIITIQPIIQPVILATNWRNIVFSKEYNWSYSDF